VRQPLRVRRTPLEDTFTISRYPLGGAQNNMKKLNRFYFILVILLMNMLFNCSPAEKPSQIKKTSNQQQSWSLNYLSENVLSCQRIDDSVAFRTTAKLGIGQWGHSWNQAFVLGRGGVFFLAPDHHMKVSFQIVSIDSAGVLIKYEYRFDHRSFGKDLISIDSGEIRFHYK
jgi:hypothetical protein